MLNQGFDIPEPKLVINLLASRDEPARFAMLINLRRELIDQYMTDVILPLAEENAAVIICSAEAKSCCLSESLTRVLRLHRARWPSRMPFTVLSCAPIRPEVYLNNDEDAIWHSLRDRTPA